MDHQGNLSIKTEQATRGPRKQRVVGPGNRSPPGGGLVGGDPPEKPPPPAPKTRTPEKTNFQKGGNTLLKTPTLGALKNGKQFWQKNPALEFKDPPEENKPPNPQACGVGPPRPIFPQKKPPEKFKNPVERVVKHPPRFEEKLLGAPPESGGLQKNSPRTMCGGRRFIKKVCARRRNIPTVGVIKNPPGWCASERVSF